ncbi:hypothetical protein [Falsibacillus albus]|uniref:Uncharacterized protein n=1 Tax=Falsibacillus albus TaxID=2478915 RepID=A0A3L7K532_9BACI|nr:hypothetical protein [Falsibacillus albus]RLQ97950.1 hypothetical protein D9X91_00735 [Falsibacillus albus]
MKQRFLLCLLLSGLLVYYAVPNLNFHAEGAEEIFTRSWLLFACFVIAGNLSALLYTPKREKPQKQGKPQMPKKKARSY